MRVAKLVMVLTTSLLMIGCFSYNLDPDTKSVANTQTFTVDVNFSHCLVVPLLERTICKDGVNFYGTGFDLNYDPAKIHFQSISVSGSVWSGTSAVTAFRNSVTDNGKLVVGISKQGQVAGETADGKIATVTFQAVGAGSTDITFGDLQLVDGSGNFLLGWRNFAFVNANKSAVTVTP